MAVQQHHVDEWFKSDLLNAIPEERRIGAEKIQQKLREAALEIVRQMKPCPEQSRAITRTRDALDAVIRGIACQAQ